MSRIAGSPLGLVGLESKSNGNFDNYNNRTRKSGKGNVSLFSGDRIVRPFAVGRGGDSPGSDIDFDNKKTTLHSDDLYNTTINNIVDKLKGTKAELSFLDFAYLKDVGVYPNNRLMIARRFATPQLDNIMYTKQDPNDEPLVTLISWKPVGDDFIDISFGEKWGDVSDGSFTSILDSIGKDFKIPEPLGKYLEGGGNAIPLPGATETIQRKFLVKLGILKDSEVQKNQIPEGNPNLIKEAKMRKLVAAGETGSGLSCGIKITMECIWEQKYIQGIDPTLAWMDILSMVTRFGTSTSQSYGLSEGLSSGVQNLLKNPDTLVRKAIEGIKEGLNAILMKIEEALKPTKSDDKSSSNENDAEKKKNKINEESSVVSKFLTKIEGALDDVINVLVQKYRERIIGVTNALSGLPSTPWHITIGNPLRPIFCSGDMYTTNVQLKLGSDLSFNDLPTKISASFTLENARPLGLQEIMAKFNSGYLRVLSYRQDDKGRLDRQENLDFSLVQDKGTTIDGDKVDVTTKSEIKSNQINQKTINSVLETRAKDRETDPIINTDPNSELKSVVDELPEQPTTYDEIKSILSSKSNIENPPEPPSGIDFLPVG